MELTLLCKQFLQVILRLRQIALRCAHVDAEHLGDLLMGHFLENIQIEHRTIGRRQFLHGIDHVGRLQVQVQIIGVVRDHILFIVITEILDAPFFAQEG